MLRKLAPLALVSLLTACSAPSTDDALLDLGDYRLGHNIVVAPKAKAVPGSRDVSQDEWVAVLTNEVGQRFSRYEGAGLYHFGISVEGYFVAPGGVPIVLSPKSALVINVTVWDDATATKLNPEVKQFTVFETTTGKSFLLGSGHVRTREEQMQGLARNAAAQIETWLAEQREREGWFAPQAGGTDELPVASSDSVGSIDAAAPAAGE